MSVAKRPLLRTLIVCAALSGCSAPPAGHGGTPAGASGKADTPSGSALKLNTGIVYFNGSYMFANDLNGDGGFGKVSQVTLLDQRTAESWSDTVRYSAPANDCSDCSSSYDFEVATDYTVISGDTLTATFSAADGSAVSCDFVYRIFTTGGVPSLADFGCQLAPVPTPPKDDPSLKLNTGIVYFNGTYMFADDLNGDGGFGKVSQVTLLDQRTAESWSDTVRYSAPANDCSDCSSSYDFEIATDYTVISGDTLTATFAAADGSAVSCDFVYRIFTAGGVPSLADLGCQLHAANP